MNAEKRPSLVVYTRVYPNAMQPNFGLFVRERMKRVSEDLSLIVVAPAPWFPFQELLGRLRPHARPNIPYREEQDGIIVYHPRFFCIPAILKWTDGWFQALGSLSLMRRLKKQDAFDLIDAHFIYPDGVAARLLARWLGCPYTITLRGSLNRFWPSCLHRWQISAALNESARIFTVARSLRNEALAWKQSPERVVVMPNGVDLEKFRPEDQQKSRQWLGLPREATLLISVGGLMERKGFQHVIAIMPKLMERWPDLHFAIAGGATPEGNNEKELRELAVRLGLSDRVHFLGPIPPDELRYVYSAGDLFVLATRFEGWANVLLEASACGLPIVTTNVGGNSEVVVSSELGILFPYGDAEALATALNQALARSWDRSTILKHAQDNAWQTRIPALVAAFKEIYMSN